MIAINAAAASSVKPKLSTRNSGINDIAEKSTAAVNVARMNLYLHDISSGAFFRSKKEAFLSDRTGRLVTGSKR